jgi:hypothetical protein
MVHNRFELKRSRVSIAFQFSIFLLIIYISFHITNLFIVSLLIFILSVSWLYSFNKNQISYLALIDSNEWTIKDSSSKKITRINIQKIIDHQLYIVIYDSSIKSRSFVIWFDQMSILQWKRLKVLAKLH